MEESEAAYAAHVKASNELHEAEMAMMRSKRAVRALNTELDKATAAAAAATEIVDRKRKAADEAAAGFDSSVRLGMDADADVHFPAAAVCIGLPVSGLSCVPSAL